jgi:hypothetical protein
MQARIEELDWGHANIEALRMAEAALRAQGEPVAWHTEDHLDDKSATTYSKAVAERWAAKGWPVTNLYTHPQGEEQ